MNTKDRVEKLEREVAKLKRVLQGVVWILWENEETQSECGTVALGELKEFLDD